jgi:hypothetical protein
VSDTTASFIGETNVPVAHNQATYFDSYWAIIRLKEQIYIYINLLLLLYKQDFHGISCIRKEALFAIRLDLNLMGGD